MNSRSLRFRLIVWYAGLLAVAFILLGSLMYVGLRLFLEQSLSKAQLGRAQQIAQTLLANIGKTSEAYVVNEINAWFAPETNDRFIRITRGDGSELYVSQSPRDLSFDAGTVPRAQEPITKSSWRTETTPDGKELLIAEVPCQTPEGKSFQVEVGAAMEPIESVLHRLIVLLILTLATMVAVAVAGGCFLVRRALAPVDQIAGSAAHITLHNLKARLPVAKTGDELERLSVSLNQMIVRLDEAVLHNQRFVADASHELRTPLTIMRGELEAMVEGAFVASDVPATAASILEEVQRLGRIVEGLFAISRLEAGEAQKEWARFDLARLATGTAEQMCLLAEDKNILISSHAPHKVIVEGDRARLKQVIVNLLDNAIKYTAAGGNIKLSVTASDDLALLEVEDNGMGIPEVARPHIFERFFRVDKARSRELGGAGLGLSIVKSICVAHGGRVDFESTEGVGSRFRVELPLAPSTNGKLEIKHGNRENGTD